MFFRILFYRGEAKMEEFIGRQVVLSQARVQELNDRIFVYVQPCRLNTMSFVSDVEVS